MFDSHVHYDHRRFDNGRDALPEKMHAEGLHFCLNAAIDFELNEQMKKLLGIGGMITLEDMEGVREAVRETPIEKILLETDSPFVRPAGMAGKRNTSESLSVIVGKIAEIKNMSEEETEKITEENAKRLFQIM